MRKITLSKCIALLFLLTIFSKIAFAEQRSSVTQYGITWYFDGSYECGQFITGDWWVVGPVTVTHTDPAQTPGRNGSVLNVTPGKYNGWDDRGDNYDESLRVTFPVSISGLKSLSTIMSSTINCWDSHGREGFTNRFGDCALTHIKTFAVLTVVESPVAEGTFRPSYIGSNYKELINISSVDFNVLPHLPKLSSPVDINLLIEKVSRPWLDCYNSWVTQFNYAGDNSYGYGRYISETVSACATALMQDIPELEQLAVLMIQKGIDNYQGIQNGAYWPGDGGHGSGRKWPVMFAGRLLNHQGMLNIGIDNPAGSNTFGEDCQTYYLPDGQPWWGIRHCSVPSMDDLALDSYRLCCTSGTWGGQMLTALMLGLREEWNHEAYFDYIDRWVNVEGRGFTGPESESVQELWTTYRNNLPPEIPHSGGSAPDTEAPTTPTNLIAGGITGSTFNLTWNASTDNVTVTQYYVFVDGVLNQTVNGSLTNTSISGLACSTTYEIEVQARDAAGNLSGMSDPITVSTLPVCDPVNVALNKTITVSSEDAPTPGTYLVDGNTADASRWSASGFPQWAEIDLGADFDLSQIELYTYQNRAYQYTIEAKPDGGTYSAIVDRSSNTTGSQPISDIISTTARFIKITVTGASGYTGTWVSLTELMVYDAGGSVVPVDVTGVSVAPETLALNVGECIDLTETVSPPDATDKSVSWSSSNENIATVDANGLICGLSAGNATVTVTTNDEGYTATCNVTVNSIPPVGSEYYCDPVNGSMSNDGSQSSPWASLEAVFAAGKTFTEGDNIYLLSGYHGSPVITGSNSSDVNILPASGQQPTIRCLSFNSASHWNLSGLTISPSTAPTYVKASELIIIDENSSYITLDNCDVYSMPSPWTTASEWSTNVCNGFHIYGHHNTFTNNHVKNIRFGYRLTPTANYNTIQNNIIENIAADGIQAVASYNVFENNTIRNCYDIDTNHDDGIQIYTIGTDGSVGTGNSVGVVIRGNTIQSYTDINQPLKGVFQGIGCFDGTYTDWVVENNLIVTNTWNGLSMHGAVNCKIVNNTVIAPDGTAPSATWIKVTAHKNGTPSSGNIVSNNIANDMACDAGAALEENNDEVSAAEYATYFEDYVNLNFNLAAGSPAIDAGTSNNAPSVDILGTLRPSGTAYDIGCYEYNGEIIHVSNISVAPITLTLELGQTAQLIETIVPINATNKTVSWSSDNSAVASVSDGQVIANSTGNAVITVTSIDGGHTATCSVTVIPASDDYNLALGKPVTTTADDAPNNIGSKLVDDDTNDASRWSADGFPQSATIDLGEECNISRLEVYTYLDRAYQYTIEASSDGSNYTQIVDRSTNTITSQPISDNVTATGRYVKITVSGANGYTGTWVSLTELKVIGNRDIAVINNSPTIDPVADSNVLDNAGQQTVNLSGISDGDGNTQTVTVVAASSDLSVVNNVSVNYISGNATGTLTFDPVSEGIATITVTVTDNGGTLNGGIDTQIITFDVTVETAIVITNLALNKPITVSAFEDDAFGYKPGENLVDGDVSDDARWSASGFPQWAEIDLGVNCDISSLQLYTYLGRAYQYTIEAKSNGGSYSVIVDRTGNTSGSQPITDAVSTTARFIKITVTGASGYTGTWVSLTELEVYGVLSPVIAPTGVSLNQTNLALDKNATVQLSETVSPVDATDKSVTWSTSDATIANVDQAGVVTAISEGIATITVTTNVGGYTATCTVEVSVPVSGVSISESSLNLETETTSDLDETVTPADATDKTVVWSTSDASVADVDQAGMVTAIAEGTATITVTTNDGGYTATCTVNVTAPSIATGSISREYWTDISGNYISDLTGSANYPSNPTGSDELSSLEAVSWVDPSVTTGIANNFGQRIRGYLIAPATGSYTFWIASDNCSDLYISTDDDPGNMTRIAYVEGSTSQYQWTKYTTQKSVVISLVAGQAYYVEILHKDGCCGDNLAVGWAKPGEGTNAPSEIVPGNVLAPYYSAAKSTKIAKQNNIQRNRSISICPNIISDGDFKISLSGCEKGRNVEIMIFDVSGKKVYMNDAISFDNKGLATIILSVGDIKQKGLYLVVASDGQSIQQQKLVIY